MNEKKAGEITAGIQINFPVTGGYLLSYATGYLEALEKAKGLEQALRKQVKWFESLKDSQHKLLVEGQDLESASSNWEDAASFRDEDALDFAEATDALVKWEKEK